MNIARRELGTVLLTGATGFVGTRVLRLVAVRPGVERVILATRFPQRVPSTANMATSVVALDLATGFTIPDGVTTIIHMAGEKRDWSAMQAVNASGTVRLLEAAARSGVRMFVHLSSVGVYGARPDSGRVDEYWVHRPSNQYERSKNAAENAVRESCERLGMEHLVLQPSNVVGVIPGSHYPLLGFVRSIRNGSYTWFGATTAWTNYIHVEDTAAAIVIAAEAAPANDSYIINTPASLPDVVRWIAEEAGVEYPRRRLPGWVGHVAGALGSVAAVVMARGMPFDLGRYRELTNSTVYDSARLTRATGFRYPIGPEATIRGLVRTYCESGLG